MTCRHAQWAEIPETSGGSYRRCTTCGLEEQSSLADLDERFSKAQEDWYDSTDPACLTPFALALSDDATSYRMDIMRSHISGGRLLEVGPGDGYFAEAAVKDGFDVIAIEDSAVLADVVRSRGVRVIQGTFEATELSDEHSFDVVATWHVIEHVLDPVEFLAQAAERTAVGGRLVLGTPNARSLEHVLARGWSPNYSLAHLRLFTDQSLSDALEAAGWDVDEIFTTDEPDHWLKVVAAFVRARGGLKRPSPPNETSDEPLSLSVEQVPASRGMALVRIFGVLTSIPRRLQARRGRGNELVAIATRRA